MGHMNTLFYCALFDGATLHFLNHVEKRGDMQSVNIGCVDVRQLIEYRYEVRSGELLIITTQLFKLGNSSLTFKHAMYDAEYARLHATSEHVVAMFSPCLSG